MEPPASQGGTTYGWAKFEGVSCIAHIDYANPGFVFVPVTSLSDVSFTGSADYQGDGHDVATFCLLTDCETVSAPDGVLDLFQNWTQSEFNVFGDSGTAEAFFNPGTEITVTTDLTTGSGNPIPTTCGGGGAEPFPTGYTGESNNLFLGPCFVTGFGIDFSESLPYSLSVTPSAFTVLRGSTATSSVQVSFTGPNEPVTLSVSGLPAGAAATLTPSAFTPSSVSPAVTPTATLTISFSISATGTLGDFEPTIQATFGESIVTFTVNLHVYDFAVAVLPPSRTVGAGATAVYTVTLNLLPGSSEVGIPPVFLSYEWAEPGQPLRSTSAFNLGVVDPGSVTVPITFTVNTVSPPAGSSGNYLGDFVFEVVASDTVTNVLLRSAPGGLNIYSYILRTPSLIPPLFQGSSKTTTWSLVLAPGSSTVGLPAVSLSLAGLPSGVTAVGFPSSLDIGASLSFILETSTVGSYVSCPQVPNSAGQNLQGANLAQCNLSGYNLQSDDLQNANLQGANLQGANLAGGNLQHANLASANTQDTDFQGAAMQYADLSAAGPTGTFTLTITATVSGVSVTSTSTLTVMGDSLSGDNLQGANLAYSNLAGVVGTSANFLGANLQYTVLQGGDYTNSNFEGAAMQYANLLYGDFDYANFSSAATYGANITGAMFVGAIDAP